MKGWPLDKANFMDAHLTGANLSHASLQRSDLRGAQLDRAILTGAKLQGADFALATTEQCLLWDVHVDRYTDFTGVSIGSLRILPEQKALIEYNVRRKQWENWYAKHHAYGWLVRVFWWASDYGRSGRRIILSLLLCAVFFALLYLTFGYIGQAMGEGPDSGIVANLFVYGQSQTPVPKWLVPVRALYFSVVTITTLGFGDMYAHPRQPWGYLFLSLHVSVGYVLLGALVTRLAILFQAGGPSGTFDEPNEHG